MLSNIDLAERFLDALSSKDLFRVKELLNENVRLEYPGLSAIHGRSKAILLLKMILSRFDSLRFEAVDRIEDGKKLCVVWKNSGRLKTGAPFHNEGITVLHIANGEIGYVNDYFKQDRVGFHS